MANEEDKTKDKPEGYLFGRPTLYDASYCLKADDYVKQCIDEWDEYHKTRGEKSDTYERNLKVKLPTHEGFATLLGVNVRLLYAWGDKYPDFQQSLDFITKAQKERLLQEGLAGNYNPIIAKLVLSSNHGMREKTDMTSDGEKVTSVKVEIVK